MKAYSSVDSSHYTPDYKLPYRSTPNAVSRPWASNYNRRPYNNTRCYRLTTGTIFPRTKLYDHHLTGLLNRLSGRYKTSGFHAPTHKPYDVEHTECESRDAIHHNEYPSDDSGKDSSATINKYNLSYTSKYSTQEDKNTQISGSEIDSFLSQGEMNKPEQNKEVKLLHNVNTSPNRRNKKNLFVRLFRNQWSRSSYNTESNTSEFGRKTCKQKENQKSPIIKSIVNNFGKASDYLNKTKQIPKRDGSGSSHDNNQADEQFDENNNTKPSNHRSHSFEGETHSNKEYIELSDDSKLSEETRKYRSKTCIPHTKQNGLRGIIKKEKTALDRINDRMGLRKNLLERNITNKQLKDMVQDISFSTVDSNITSYDQTRNMFHCDTPLAVSNLTVNDSQDKAHTCFILRDSVRSSHDIASDTFSANRSRRQSERRRNLKENHLNHRMETRNSSLHSCRRNEEDTRYTNKPQDQRSRSNNKGLEDEWDNLEERYNKVITRGMPSGDARVSSQRQRRERQTSLLRYHLSKHRREPKARVQIKPRVRSKSRRNRIHSDGYKPILRLRI